MCASSPCSHTHAAGYTPAAPFILTFHRSILEGFTVGHNAPETPTILQFVPARLVRPATATPDAQAAAYQQERTGH